MARPQFDLFATEASERVGPADVPDTIHQLGARLSPRIRLGTSSWSFPGWAGIVYDRHRPEAQLARAGLGAYARHPVLRAVSIDRSYYGPIPTERYADWAADVPADFRFAVKIDRVCTMPDLGRRGEALPNPYFLDAAHAATSTIEPAMRGLRDRLGVFILQLPPLDPRSVDGPRGFADRLARFLGDLPADAPVAVELRSPGLFTPRYADTLRLTGASHCYTVHPRMRSLRAQLDAIPVDAGPRLVVRWMLHAGLRYDEAKARYQPFDRIVEADPETREDIARACSLAIDDDRDVCVFINNKAEGSAPLSAIRLAETIVGR